MLHRYPDGITGKDFYQKNIAEVPKGIKRYGMMQEGKEINYLIINDMRSPLYAINLGSIDLHPFLAKSSHIDHPEKHGHRSRSPLNQL